MAATSPYTTATALGLAAPNYVPNVEDNERVRAYSTYSDIFNNTSNAFKNVLRQGDDEMARRYIPAARGLVEATNRYLAKDLTWTATVPADVTLSDEDVDLTMQGLDNLFTREEFNAKFLALKRWFLIKGDAMIHLSADPGKAEGARIRITELAPDNYFTIMDGVDAERVVGAYVVTILVNESESVAQRLEYRRILNEEESASFQGPIGSIFCRIGYYELDGWDDRLPFTESDLKPVPPPAWISQPPELPLQMAGFVLPPSITAIPVYHMRNNRKGNAPFGLSEVQGLESVLAGITQNATDEDMAAALMGLGLYWTDSGHPVDTQGNEVDWQISPASIIELEDGKKVGRLDGLTSVAPIQDHIAYLKNEAREGSAVSDAAIGRVDVQVAQSGIALAIDMAPILSKNGEKEVELKSKLDQFMYDLLNGWLPAYEGVAFNGIVVKCAFGDPLPVNRKEEIDAVAAMITAGIIDAEFARELLGAKLGITFPSDMGARMEAAQQAALDAVGGRLDQAAADGGVA